MTTLFRVMDKAEQRFDVLWDTVILPKGQEWFTKHGEYAQCLYTQNLPDNKLADADARYLLPVTDLEPGDRPGMTAKAIFGTDNIDTFLPFAFAVHVYESPKQYKETGGHGIVAQEWVKYEGITYMRAKNYGPESWRAHDWEELAEEDVLVARFTGTYLPTFTRMADATMNFTRRLFRRA